MATRLTAEARSTGLLQIVGLLTGAGLLAALLHWRMAGRRDQAREMSLRRCRPVSVVPGSAFKGFRFPPEIIVLAVRWYLRYGLSYRDLEELLAERVGAGNAIGRAIRAVGIG
jgi:hypothetical protein